MPTKPVLERKVFDEKQQNHCDFAGRGEERRGGSEGAGQKKKSNNH